MKKLLYFPTDKGDNINMNNDTLYKVLPLHFEECPLCDSNLDISSKFAGYTTYKCTYCSFTAKEKN